MVQWLFILIASYLAFQVGRLLGREEVYEQWVTKLLQQI